MTAWLMSQTNDEAMGAALTSKVIRYYEDELPGYLRHPERFDISICYLNEGSYEKAIETTLTRLNNGFWSGWWQWQRNPVARPIVEDPRVQDAVARMKEDLAMQRENVRRMEAEGEI